MKIMKKERNGNLWKWWRGLIKIEGASWHPPPTSSLPPLAFSILNFFRRYIFEHWIGNEPKFWNFNNILVFKIDYTFYNWQWAKNRRKTTRVSIISKTWVFSFYKTDIWRWTWSSFIRTWSFIFLHGPEIRKERKKKIKIGQHLKIHFHWLQLA